MRGYDARAAALALHVPPKWIDNLLSHHAIPGVVQSRQGVRRLIPPESLRTVAVALKLMEALRLPLPAALHLAAQLRLAGGQLSLTGRVTLSLDLEALDRSLDRELALAVEATPSPRRGRPPATMGRRRA